MIYSDYNSLIFYLSLIKKLNKKLLRYLVTSDKIKDISKMSFSCTAEYLNHLNNSLNAYKNFNKNVNNVDINIGDLYKTYVLFLRINKLFKLYEVNYISFLNKTYPFRFKNLNCNELFYTDFSADSPVLLFYIGEINILNAKNISAVIGTRKPCLQSLEMEKKLTENLINKNNVIVSGLAKGCDMTAHETCLEKDGKTVAFIGSDLVNYIKRNNKICKKFIDNNNLIVSEYAYEEKIKKYFFIQRDRLISLSSDDIYVIQTSLKGGSFHAVKAGIKYKKKLYTFSDEVFINADVKSEEIEGNKYLIENKLAEKISLSK